jgi:hypothetical protein
MKGWRWMLTVISLAVLLSGCAASGGQPQQTGQTREATVQEQVLAIAPSSTVEQAASTDTPPPTLEKPASTETRPPTVEEPPAGDTPLPTAGEPTSTSMPSATAPPTVTEPTATQTPAPRAALSSEDVQRLTPEQAHALLDTEQAVLFDVRSVSEYRTAHAAGALSLPGTDLPTRLGELPPEKSLVFY